MQRFRMRVLLTFLLCGFRAFAHADTTVKTRTVNTDSAPPANVRNHDEHLDVRYRKGRMRRKDILSDRAAIVFSNIANCDARTGFLVDPTVHEYRIYKVVRFPAPSQLDEYRKKHPEHFVEIQSATVETGERKTFFGHQARHFISTTRRAPDKANPGGEETVDGWYIEHETPDSNCAPDYVHTEPLYVIGTGLVLPWRIAHFNHTGPIPTGLAVQVIFTHREPAKEGAAERVFRTEQTVEELSDAPLSPSLFDLPLGLRENPDLLGPQAEHQ
jgi:hypothetical protein